jgi:hypothetical protein
VKKIAAMLAELEIDDPVVSELWQAVQKDQGGCARSAYKPTRTP